jgi:hypothetical protein
MFLEIKSRCKYTLAMLAGIVVAASFVTQTASAATTETVEQLIQKHLKEQGLNYQIGSPEWDAYLHDVTWGEDESLFKHPRYQDILHYANVYLKRKVDPSFKDESRPVVGIPGPKKASTDNPSLAFTTIPTIVSKL